MAEEVQELSRAFEIVGRFLFHFARLEAELDRALGKLLGLDTVTTQIVGANVDFSRKLKIVRSAEKWLAEKPSAERQNLLRSFKEVYELNDARVIAAHAQFEPLAGGGVRFIRVVANTEIKIGNVDWSDEKANRLIDQIEHSVTVIGRVADEMTPYSGTLDFSDPRNSGLLGVL